MEKQNFVVTFDDGWKAYVWAENAEAARDAGVELMLETYEILGGAIGTVWSVRRTYTQD